jgi:hypothetical protein
MPVMTERARSIVRAAIPVLALLLSLPAFAADLVVPSLELITHGATNDDGIFTLQTYGDIELEIHGGYQFAAVISLGITDSNLENLANTAASTPGDLSFGFLSASVGVRNLFSLPLTASFFVGLGDTFCSAEGFTKFGAESFMTLYRGYYYFPTGPLYDGIYRVQGTGIHLELTPVAGALSADLYAYEDTHGTYDWSDSAAFTTLGNYSGDLRFLLNLATVKLECFVGGTYSPLITDYFFRGGLLFYAQNRNVEFLAQIGIPKWDPALDAALNVNLFYLLVEPRLHLGIFSIVPTFFWHPGYYMQVATASELGAFDVNLNISCGDLEKSSIEGGLEGALKFKSSEESFTVAASPWLGFTTPGILWKVKVNAKLWPFSLADMFDVFVGVRAEL